MQCVAEEVWERHNGVTSTVELIVAVWVKRGDEGHMHDEEKKRRAAGTGGVQMRNWKLLVCVARIVGEWRKDGWISAAVGVLKYACKIMKTFN